jgi:RNA polymerase sigma factor (TIGR02999 family)
MPPDPRPVEHLTSLLQDLHGDAAQLRTTAFSGVYAELRRIARQYLARERAGHTLQATALVHEAWLRLFGTEQVFGNGQEFLAAAANTMRRVLVDHARARGRQKRGSAPRRVPLDALQLATVADATEILAVDEAVQALDQLDPRLAEQTKLRLFAGLDDVEIAAALGVSDRTVRRDWMLARAFLHRQLLTET